MVNMKHVKIFEDFLTEASELTKVLRKLGWFGEDWTPKDFAKQIKELSDSTLQLWHDDLKKNKGIPNTPLAFQQKLVKIEMQKRGLLESIVNEAEDEKVTLNVTISNIDQETANDFLTMFAFMEWCGNVGTARTMRAFFDGDGHFRPQIKVEGHDLHDIEVKEPGENKEIDLDLGFGA